MKDFEALDTQVLGISVDSVPCHEAWAKSLGTVTFPLLSDMHRRACRAYGVFSEERNTAERAVFLIDKEGRMAHAEQLERRQLPDLDKLLTVAKGLGSA